MTACDRAFFLSSAGGLGRYGQIDMTTDYPGKVKTGPMELEVDAATLGEFFGITAHAVRILQLKKLQFGPAVIAFYYNHRSRIIADRFDIGRKPVESTVRRWR
jgi:hypothetical protein